jgi:predicted MPP superfamily phosphohydrolase
MKTVVIGDIHGRSLWKDIIGKEAPDSVIFVGDYVDSFEISGAFQLYNLLEIVAYRAAHPEVTLLIGNHDMHYFRGYGRSSMEGFQMNMMPIFSQTFEDNKHLFKAAHRMGEFLFTQAGLSVSFMNRYFGDSWSLDTAADDINDLWKYKPEAFKLDREKNPSGSYPDASPVWIRPRKLMQDCRDIRKDIIQIREHLKRRVTKRQEYIYMHTRKCIFPRNRLSRL